MIYEITQIKKWLARKFKLRTEGEGGNLRVLDPVPDGIYTIPIGHSKRPSRVKIENGSIHIL